MKRDATRSEPATLDAPIACFGTFVHEHHISLYRTAYLLTGNAVDAEELLQDTLVRLYPRWDRVTAADLPLAYVRRSLINGYVTVRRSPRHQHVPLTEAVQLEHQRDQGVTGVDDRDHLTRLLQPLPGRQRAALVLRYYLGLPDEEIAASLGCRPVTVRSLVSRAIATLRAAEASPPLHGRSHR